MPFRIDPSVYPNRTKVQFTTSAKMPSMIYKACVKTGVQSNTVYIQHAVAHALARDLGIPVEDIIADLPTPKGHSAHLFERKDGRRLPGPANTIETVK